MDTNTTTYAARFKAQGLRYEADRLARQATTADDFTFARDLARIAQDRSRGQAASDMAQLSVLCDCARVLAGGAVESMTATAARFILANSSLARIYWARCANAAVSAVVSAS